MSFNTLGLAPKILQAVTDAGYELPTPIQAAAIPHILNGTDLIGIAQTGTGKTAAFALPLLQRLTTGPLVSERSRTSRRAPRALILAPTRELAAQIDEALRLLSLHLHIHRVTIFGGVGEQPQISALRRGVDVIVATPGRLLDLMQSGHVDLRQVTYAVFDEADRMLDMGFLPQIRRVVAALPRERQTLLFSATLSKEIEMLTKEFLRSPQIVQIGRRANPADTVAQFLYPVPKSKKIDLLLELLRDKNLDSVLVFSRTKHGADKIARKLVSAGISTATLHSNRSQGQRTSALNAFRGGKVRVLVATDIAARGIDVEGISHVINFDFPMHPEDYVHRIGRTGRAEAEGDAISFVTPEDESSVRDLEKMTKKTIERKRIADFDYRETAIVSTYMDDRVRHRAPQRPSQHRGRTQPQRSSAAPSAHGRRSSEPAARSRAPQRSTSRAEAVRSRFAEPSARATSSRPGRRRV